MTVPTAPRQLWRMPKLAIRRNRAIKSPHIYGFPAAFLPPPRYAGPVWPHAFDGRAHCEKKRRGSLGPENQRRAFYYDVLVFLRCDWEAVEEWQR